MVELVWYLNSLARASIDLNISHLSWLRYLVRDLHLIFELLRFVQLDMRCDSKSINQDLPEVAFVIDSSPHGAQSALPRCWCLRCRLDHYRIFNQLKIIITS